MGPIAWFLVQKLIDVATSPAVKRWAIDELKQMDVASSNAYVKVVIETAEKFLLEQAA